MKFKTYAFFDLETTGIPLLESTKTRITELSLVACSVEHLGSSSSGSSDYTPRALNKLNLCFNPRKIISPKAEEITKLNNYMLEHFKKFDSNTGCLIKSYLAQLEEPICLIAHNGSSFDFPLLKQELDDSSTVLPDNIYCVDSLEIFREIDFPSVIKLKGNDDLSDIIPLKDDVENSTALNENKQLEEKTEIENSPFVDPEDILNDNKTVDWQKLNETTPKSSTQLINKRTSKRAAAQSVMNSENSISQNLSFAAKRKLFPEKYKKGRYTLDAVYERTFKSKPADMHFAEADVMSLLKCISAQKDKFVQYVEDEAKPFKDVRTPQKMMNKLLK